jgi:hypothetical protein
MLCLPDGILAQILRQLPRVAQLRMRLASRRCCARITALVSNPHWGRVVRFDRMFSMPVEIELDSVFAEFSFLFALCRRFGVDDRNWVLRIYLPHLRGPITADAYGPYISLAEAFGSRLAIELRVGSSYEGDPPDFQDGFASGLASLLDRVPQLAALSIDDCCVCDAALSTLEPSLLQLPDLRSLALPDNYLGGSWAMRLLPSFLASMTQLTSLNLAGNCLDPLGAVAIAPALAQLTALTSLDLSLNNLDGPAGVCPLLPALAALTQLTALDLKGHHNCLFGPGVEALAPVLKTLTGLKSLSLGEFEHAQLVSLQVGSWAWEGAHLRSL